jgi:hypothetical protein
MTTLTEIMEREGRILRQTQDALMVSVSNHADLRMVVVK